TASASPRPGVALADQSPKHAAFELERAGALQGDAARIGLAVLGVVDLPVPFVGRAARLHAEHDLNADERPVAQARIGIVLVGLRSAGRGIVRLVGGANGA